MGDGSRRLLSGYRAGAEAGRRRQAGCKECVKDSRKHSFKPKPETPMGGPGVPWSGSPRLPSHVPGLCRTTPGLLKGFLPQHCPLCSH